MASKKSHEKEVHPGNSELPKYKQFIRMLSFRIVPSYFVKIEKIADDNNTTVSALIREYIKEGMKRDLKRRGDISDFRIENYEK